MLADAKDIHYNFASIENQNNKKKFKLVSWQFVIIFVSFVSLSNIWILFILYFFSAQSFIEQWYLISSSSFSHDDDSLCKNDDHIPIMNHHHHFRILKDYIIFWKYQIHTLSYTNKMIRLCFSFCCTGGQWQMIIKCF